MLKKCTEDGLENNSRNALIKLLDLINFSDSDYAKSLRDTWTFRHAEEVVKQEAEEVVYQTREELRGRRRND
ncbi:hypothetical protein KM911_17925 [Bacillus paralicheniformis]|uniref:hypothetical protein n=1 Tax=Bacillus TaxID=1386 RepID=UPI001C2270E4|nr:MULTISPECIES: hypothetical protein [Bacillus]MBU8583579.1 hypothetical protein [Bacillus paralicheniformis]MCY8243545.1 hypothetical protein [Bacillus haynesii]MCY8565776.1 hypothetical protein [Bacillus haynesii]MEC1437400.1 hypothetical protein [Bacillus sonorensis]WMW48416.1 hypothetical protein RFN66_05505 [Bacillus paralicheniformis]